MKQHKPDRISCFFTSQTALLKSAGVHNPYKGHDSIIWPWWSRGLTFLNSTRCNNWKDCSCQATTPMALHREQTKTETHSSCENSQFARSTDFEFPTHLETKEALSGNIRRHHPHKYPRSHYGSMKSPRKELTYSSRASIFTTVSQKTPPDFDLRHEALIEQHVFV